MNTEAMKQMLEALKPVALYKAHNGDDWPARQVAPVITALREALANEALDRMAENARELGLDYEPAQQESALDMCEHRCPQVTWHRGPSFVCQKAGHGVGQNSYCEKCECPQAIEAAHGIKENT